MDVKTESNIFGEIFSLNGSSESTVCDVINKHWVSDHTCSEVLAPPSGARSNQSITFSLETANRGPNCVMLLTWSQEWNGKIKVGVNLELSRFVLLFFSHWCWRTCHFSVKQATIGIDFLSKTMYLEDRTVRRLTAVRSVYVCVCVFSDFLGLLKSQTAKFNMSMLLQVECARKQQIVIHRGFFCTFWW